MPKFINVINKISMFMCTALFVWGGSAVPKDEMPLSFFFEYYAIIIILMAIFGSICYLTDKYLKEYNHQLMEAERRRRNRETRRRNRLGY